MARPHVRILNWLDERFGAGSVEQFLRHKTVPLHRHTVWYYFGGMTLFLFVIQVLTGILLLLYYRPTPADAFESVQYIMTRVQFGWLIRSVHSWSANLMVLAAVIHMFSVFFLRSYRRPRELTWLTGMALLGLTLAFTFVAYSGTLGYQFAYDDRFQIVESPYIRAWRFVPRYFTEHVWSALLPEIVVAV